MMNAYNPMAQQHIGHNGFMPEADIRAVIAALDISKSDIGIVLQYAYSAPGNLLYYKCLRTSDIVHLKWIYSKYKPAITVVGLSSMYSQKLTKNGQFTKNFIHRNRSWIGPFTYVNEYRTTINSKANIFNYNHNVYAAMLILQRWYILIIVLIHIIIVTTYIYN
jgi:RNase H-fold protein (predicted Holliday junction resolvase)